MKKLLKKKQLLTEVIVPECIQQNILTKSQINNEIVVVDGGDDGNPPIVPPDGVIWHSLSVPVRITYTFRMNPILHVDLNFPELMVPYLLFKCLEKIL